MIKNKSTYEIMTPESIGLMRGDSQSGAGIVLGKHSGRNAVSTRLRELGYDLEPDKLNAVFTRFKEVAEKRKGGLEDEDLEALVMDQAGLQNVLWEVTGLQCATGMSGIPTATVKMMGPDGIERYLSATGTGPVDAVYKAIDQIMGVSVKLETYSLRSVAEGIEVRTLRSLYTVIHSKLDILLLVLSNAPSYIFLSFVHSFIMFLSFFIYIVTRV
jgi:2-isopropylmalate synthase